MAILGLDNNTAIMIGVFSFMLLVFLVAFCCLEEDEYKPEPGPLAKKQVMTAREAADIRKDILKQARQQLLAEKKKKKS